jgi:hypothetical protein
MNTWLANTAIQGAVAAILMAGAALLAAVANWFNTRSRMMQQGLEIADLQRQTMHLAAVQTAQAATPPASAPPTIITLPAAPGASHEPRDGQA